MGKSRDISRVLNDAGLVDAPDLASGAAAGNLGFTPANSQAENILFRNRIINGDMRIDQRNAGAAVTTNGGYPVDRWVVENTTTTGTFSSQQDSSAPAGFVTSLKTTITAADASLSNFERFVIRQIIEGYNSADLNWGTANAKTVTVSFWVRCSVTGTFGGSLHNGAEDRSYPFEYTISAANTWEQKSITIAGDTTGTWLITNGKGIFVNFSLGAASLPSGTANAWTNSFKVSTTGATNLVATNGATFYITGVQLEVGSVATPFERRPYGTELSLCQRYCFKFSAGDNYQRYGGGVNGNTTQSFPAIQLPTVMRADPTMTTTGTASNYAIYTGTAVIVCSAVPIIDSSSDGVIRPTLQTTVSGGLTQGNYTDLISNNNTTSYLLFSAEL